MGVDKQFLQLEGPSLVADNECAAMMVASETTYYVLKRKAPDPTDAFTPIIDLIEWLNVKGLTGSISSTFKPKEETSKSKTSKDASPHKDKTIYYIGKLDPFPHEIAMAKQNDWPIEKLKNKKLTEKEVGQLEMAKFKNKYQRIDVSESPVAEDLTKFKLANIAPGPAIVPTEKLQKLYMLAAFSLAAKKAADKGRVAAILVTNGGEVLSYGVKSTDNAILHAEVTAIQSLFVNNPVRAAALSSEPTYLFTTLKPCGMCAAMIKACGAGKIHVVFGQNDSGDGATNTCLDGSPGMHHKLATDLKLKDAKEQTLLTELDGHRLKNPGGPIVHSLDSADPKQLMALAHARTLHKVKKYGDSLTDSDKKKVMAHLESFLKALELVPG